MSEKVLEIFKLCERLADLLGDEEAVADLKFLYEHHPEMFEDKNEVKQVIQKVVNEPEIIVDATHSNKDTGIYKVARRLNKEKMADVVIKNQDGVNKIFHANKKKIKEFERLKKQIEAGGRVAHFLHPDLKSAWAGSNKHSPTSNQTIPNTPQKSQILSKQETLINKMLKTQDEFNSMPRAKDFTKDFEKDLEQSFNVKIDDEDLKKDEGNKFKKGHIMKTNQILKSHLKDIL